MQRLVYSRMSGLLLIVILAGNCGGMFLCNDTFDEFRAAAADDLEGGVNQILDGLVAGVFALVDPDETSDTTSRSRNRARASSVVGEQ